MPWKDPEKRRAYSKAYNARPEVIKRRREYDQRPEAIKRRREYNRRPKAVEQRREYARRPENKLKWKKYIAEYAQRPENKSKMKEYNRRSEVKKKKREYKNRPEVKKRDYQLKKNNPNYIRAKNLRDKLRAAVIHQKNYISTIHKLIGCDVPTARAHLEAQFEPWMTWENYGNGKGKWNIDHIKRISSIDIFDEDEVKRIFHYSNMRPLCYIKNCEDTDDGRGLL